MNEPAAPTSPSVPVDIDRLARWMDARRLGSGPLADVELLSGGTQNILVRFSRGERGDVLRRPPIHKRPNSDETMRREARVLGSLAGSAVPHPALIAVEPDVEVLGSAFYLMEPVEGFNASVAVPEPHRSSPTMQREMGLAMPAAIASLGLIDPVASGLGDLGRTDGWLDRQVSRWRRQLDSYDELAGYGGSTIAGVDAVASWLDRHQPAQMRVGIIHGDFHFANVLVAPDRGEVAAVVDWELATLGDPLLDLGHLLATWPGQAGIVSIDAPHLPTADEVIERYAVLSGRDLTDLLWFRVLACYRLGIILEGSHARAAAGLAPVEGDLLHANAVALFELALDLVST